MLGVESLGVRAVRGLGFRVQVLLFALPFVQVLSV